MVGEITHVYCWFNQFKQVLLMVAVTKERYGGDNRTESMCMIAFQIQNGKPPKSETLHQELFWFMTLVSRSILYITRLELVNEPQERKIT